MHTDMPHTHAALLSGDDLFSTPKTSQSLSNSDLRYLRHSSDSDRLQVLETLRSTSYSKPLPAVPNTTACSFCQGMTCFLLQSCLGVFPTQTSDTFGILWTLTTSEFQRHFTVLPTLTPFQQSPMLPHAPSTLTPHPTLPLKAALRPPPPPKITQRPLWTLHPLIQTPLRHSLETLQVIVEIG